MAVVEVMGRVSISGRRRRSAAERRLIVEETLEAGMSVARVAQKYGINANQVFQWRRLYRDGHLGGTPSNELKLLPVSVVEDDAVKPTGTGADLSSAGSIHIELRGEIRISVEGSVDQGLVLAVLKSLRS